LGVWAAHVLTLDLSAGRLGLPPMPQGGRQPISGLRRVRRRSFGGVTCAVDTCNKKRAPGQQFRKVGSNLAADGRLADAQNLANQTVCPSCYGKLNRRRARVQQQRKSAADMRERRRSAPAGALLRQGIASTLFNLSARSAAATIRRRGSTGSFTRTPAPIAEPPARDFRYPGQRNPRQRAVLRQDPRADVVRVRQGLPYLHRELERADRIRLGIVPTNPTETRAVEQFPKV
jgi:hypothetical protein